MGISRLWPCVCSEPHGCPSRPASCRSPHSPPSAWPPRGTSLAQGRGPVFLLRLVLLSPNPHARIQNKATENSVAVGLAPQPRSKMSFSSISGGPRMFPCPLSGCPLCSPCLHRLSVLLLLLFCDGCAGTAHWALASCWHPPRGAWPGTRPDAPAGFLGSVAGSPGLHSC